MRSKPKVAILRGPLLNPYEMQSYELLQDDFELVAFAPHQTQFDLASINLPKESLWCPIAAKAPLERSTRKWQTYKDALVGNTFSFCGMRDRLKGFDILHIKDQAFCFSYEAALAKREFGGKLVVTQMENIPHLNERKFMERHIKKTVREQADLFLAASEGAVHTLLEEGVPREKIQRIANSVNVKHFSPGKPDAFLRKSFGIPKDAFVLLYVGRLARSKGVFTLLETVKKLKQENCFVHLLMVGKDEESIADWIEKNEIGDLVHLSGFVAYGDMPRYYRLANLSILPSLPTKGWLEQFGYVLAESMACGIPAIGSDCGAIPEVIGDPNLIFPAGSVEGLSQILKKLRKQPLQSMKKRVRKRACELFASEVLRDSLRNAYLELLEK